MMETDGALSFFLGLNIGAQYSGQLHAKPQKKDFNGRLLSLSKGY